MPITLMPLALPGLANLEEFSQSTPIIPQSIPAALPGSNTITSELSGVASSAITRAVSSVISRFLDGWFGARGVTLILGLMLIAAAIFTHPTVIKTVQKAGKTAAEAAVAAG